MNADWLIRFLSQVSSTQLQELSLGFYELPGRAWDTSVPLKLLENVLLMPQFRTLVRIVYTVFFSKETKADLPARLPRLASMIPVQEIKQEEYFARYWQRAPTYYHLNV